VWGSEVSRSPLEAVACEVRTLGVRDFPQLREWVSVERFTTSLDVCGARGRPLAFSVVFRLGRYGWFGSSLVNSGARGSRGSYGFDIPIWLIRNRRPCCQ
jgi:hypothetical protein